ncbi:MAG: hypothetical protein LIO96_00290 [Lachnospiraceae bacterium]|nr:hypothetical protein [Lachnospiraceae bacterium]
MGKNIADMGKTFLTVKGFLENDSFLCKYVEECEIWKRRYSRYWYRNIINGNFVPEEKKRLQEELKIQMDLEYLDMPTPSDEYYYEKAKFLK